VAFFSFKYKTGFLSSECMNDHDGNSRRTFLRQSLLLGASVVTALTPGFGSPKKRMVITVSGPRDAGTLRHVLTHEHILVDFVGAKDINPPRWNHAEVIDKVLPYLQEAKDAGCNTFVDCTPNYLGRDVTLLRELSEKSGLLIVTNTGYYGGSDHKFLPAHAFTETADQLANRWIEEWQNGIDETSIRPGFIKISVNPSRLSGISLKLINAAARTHLKTGLTIAAHTGPAVAAFEQIEVLKSYKIDPAAFIWVHAQNESDKNQFVKAVEEGAWVSLDGLREDNILDYVRLLQFLKKEQCLHRILVSHDAGWYDPGKPGGGEIRGYSTLFRKLIPALEQNDFVESEVLQLIQHNPANAFSKGVRKLKKKRV
jgi:phosphotriesterase-related protein